jgi:hypothetical protein
VTDDDFGESYPFRFLGTPRAFRINYSYRFGM